MNLKLKEVKINAHGGLDVSVFQMNEGTKSYDEKDIKGCKQEPLDEQLKAFDALKPILIDICDLPKKWANSIDVKGFKIAWQKNEHSKVSIQAIRHLQLGGPFNINSPQRNVTAEDEGATNILSDAQAILVDEAINAALNYWGGYRKAEPVSESEQAHRTAYAKGQQAFKDGKMLFNNEYNEEHGVDAVRSWIAGFTDAEQEKADGEADMDARNDKIEDAEVEEVAEV